MDAFYMHQVHEDYYVKSYINGLRAKNKPYMKPFKPQTLFDVVETVRSMEMRVHAKNS
jgi:hypothetical protein